MEMKTGSGCYDITIWENGLGEPEDVFTLCIE